MGTGGAGQPRAQRAPTSPTMLLAAIAIGLLGAVELAGGESVGTVVATALLLVIGLVGMTAAAETAGLRRARTVPPRTAGYDGGPSPRWHDELEAALAAPVTLAVLGTLLLGLGAVTGPSTTLPTGLAWWLGRLGVGLALVAMLPAAALPGGRALTAVLARRRDRLAARRGSATAGLVAGGLLVAAGTLTMADTGAFGLVAVLGGWFLVLTNITERSLALAVDVLRQHRVADVMVAPPAALPGWTTVDDALLRAAVARSPILPVSAFDGELDGIADVRVLGRVPLAQRAATRLSTVAVPLAVVPRAEPGERADVLLDRMARRRGLPVLVGDGSGVVGIVTAADVRRVLAAARGRRT